MTGREACWAGKPVDRSPEVASYNTEASKKENMKDSGPPCPAGSEVKVKGDFIVGGSHDQHSGLGVCFPL